MSQLALFAQPAPAADPRRYVRMHYESSEIDERTGQPFRWTNVVDEAEADRTMAEARERWTDVKVSVGASFNARAE